MPSILREWNKVGYWSLTYGAERACWSAGQWEVFGRQRSQPPFSTAELLTRIPPDDRASYAALLAPGGIPDDESYCGIFKFVRDDGKERLIAAHFEVVLDEGGKAVGVQGSNKDVTDEMGLRGILSDSRGVLDAIGSGVALISTEGVVLFANDELCRLVGRDRAEVVGRGSPFELRSADESGRLEELIRLALRGQVPSEAATHEIVRPDGSRRHVEIRLSRLFPGLPLSAVVISAIDVTDRVKSEEKRLLSEATFRGAFEFAPVGMAICDLDSKIIEVNSRFAEILGVGSAELVGLSWFTLIPESDHAQVQRRVSMSGTIPFYVREGQMIAPTGRRLVVEIHCAVVLNSAGLPSHYVTQIVDLGQKRETERQLQDMALRFQQVTETIDDVFWISSRDVANAIYVSPAYEAIWGRSIESFYNNPRTFMEAVHPEDRAEFRRTMALQEMGYPFQNEYRIIRPDGEVRWILDKGFPVVEPDGRILKYVGVARDVSQAKNMTGLVEQAQRLEAIGQLTGELAHDFNNLLSIITMNALQAQKRAGADQRLNRQLDTIVATASRGGRVTKALLAAARRQHLNPEICSIDSVIESTRGLIETSAGPLTEVRFVSSNGVAVAEVDPAALSNALLNLVINARDAMPGGGVLTISTSVVPLTIRDPHLVAAGLPEGLYVQIEVRDTGTGMTDEIAGRAWEPFFTTKEPGRGSGLGLAAVYGFARQSRGTAVLDSVIGRGTSVRILIPQANRETTMAPAVAEHLRRGWGRILLVDDEPDLLEVMSETLSQLGYTVVSVESGREALLQLERQGFDFMLSDVAMRRMSGLELARQAHELRPAMKILLMTGFAAGAMPAELPWRVLEKPLAPDDLAAALSDAMVERDEARRTT